MLAKSPALALSPNTDHINFQPILHKRGRSIPLPVAITLTLTVALTRTPIRTLTLTLSHQTETGNELWLGDVEISLVYFHTGASAVLAIGSSARVRY